ncbi:hypothetical protein [Bacteroides finegoldii]|uniref:hypothetical protein n=1 Tax=Bacteroides finegoldii TaxID=338188 RepID=UPI0012FD4406|nr:hypothetical protein [Bacteroides finegoldii]
MIVITGKGCIANRKAMTSSKKDEASSKEIRGLLPRKTRSFAWKIEDFKRKIRGFFIGKLKNYKIRVQPSIQS